MSTASLWSRVRWRGLLHQNAVEQPGEDRTDARERLRVAPFLGLIPAANQDVDNGAPSPPDPAASDAAAEFHRRVRCWSQQLDRRGVKGTQAFGHLMTIIEERPYVLLFTGFLGIIGMCFLIFVALGIRDHSIVALIQPLVTGLLLLSFFWLMLALAGRRAAHESTLETSLASGLCPNCKTPVRLDINMHPTSAVNPYLAVGPAACPGCNLAWPRVPPPIPQAAAAAFAPASPVKVWTEPQAPAGDFPPLGPAVTRWDLAGSSLRHLTFPSLRLEHRERLSHFTLPRFGRRRRTRLRPGALSLVLVIIVFSTRPITPDWAWPLIFLVFIVASMPSVLFPWDRWKLGAIRRARCTPFQRALATDGPLPSLAETLRDRRSTASMTMIDKSLRGQGWRMQSRNTRLLMLSPMLLWVGAFIVPPLISRLSPGVGAGRNMLSLWTFPLLLLCLFVFLGVMWTNGKRLRRTLLASASASRCCDCNYDLSSLPSAIDPDRIDGLETGPARCPECGAPWPMVPPRAS